MNRSLLRSFPLLLSASLLAGCAPLGYGVQSMQREQDRRTFTPVFPSFKALAGAQLYQGFHRGVQGAAAYAVEVPANWNGTLVMYAHGYAGEGAELRVQAPPLREYWLSQGYAWAASSYSSNYYDVRAGVEDTNALALLFPRITGRPAPGKTLIMGVSMGGHIAGAAVEAETARTARSKVRYAAAMPVCGVMDPTYEFQWLGDYAQAAAQLAGFGGRYPNPDFQKNLPQIRAALFTSTSGPLWQENANQGTVLKNLARQLTGGERPVFDLGFRVGALQTAVLGTGGSDGTLNGILARNFYGNQGLTYRWTTGETPSAEEVAFNAALPRAAADPNANPPRPDGVRWLPQVSGEISVPVLTMHTLGDFYVPFKHQQNYRRAVARSGNENLLVQRAVRAPGHCDFVGAELVEGFNDLVAWEKTGQKPAGDDVLTANVLADPNYGCAFTRQTREGVAACPARQP
ncbi:hypothetical protein SAMN04488058_10846 [Deinococcus reticulitermitis]|uniref:Alpha/beta hydrolase family protein n=1 Tax=Deinococcus reticulitermitis TaxID=856736 RepID=A0A1H6YSJ2_9DEIO|nr:alpha/beta hydrolase [Deinococcus reticulitermitis]SEJ44209.1 hypothetical protein SAMN04488058_10846 [Deinococcus reticulitermitis]